jgi:hypothetical protein
MMYMTLVIAHVLGAALLGAAVAAGLVAATRVRRARTPGQVLDALAGASTAARRIAAPAAILLLVSGSWLAVGYFGGWTSARIPWLAAMAGLFALEALRVNTLVRRDESRLARLAERALEQGRITPELELARTRPMQAFGRTLEVTMYLLIVALGAFRLTSWPAVLAGVAAALLVALALAFYPRAASLSSASVVGDGRV